jgi:hypothetical protein
MFFIITSHLRIGDDSNDTKSSPCAAYADDLRRYVMSVTRMSISDCATLVGRVEKFLRFVSTENGDIDVHVGALRSDPKVNLSIYIIIALFLFNHHSGLSDSICSATTIIWREVIHDLQPSSRLEAMVGVH